MGGGRRASPAAMHHQRPRPYAAIAGFGAGVAAAGTALSQSTRQDLTPLAAKLTSLAGIRTAADKGTMSALTVFQAYNAIVDAQFQFFRGEAVISDGPISLYQEGAANIDGGQALELVGREAALVGGALAAGGGMARGTRDQFGQDVYDQPLLEQDAPSPVNWPGTTSPYTQLFDSATYTDFETLENQIIDTAPGARIAVSPTAWQSGVTSFI